MGTLDETVEHLKEPDFLAQFSSQATHPQTVSKQFHTLEASFPKKNVNELKNKGSKDISVKVNHVCTEDLQCQKVHSMCITARGIDSVADLGFSPGGVRQLTKSYYFPNYLLKTA